MTKIAPKLHIALYQPDIAQNTGTLMRLSRCLNMHLDLIAPLGFSLGTKALRRAGLDYIDETFYTLYESFAAYIEEISHKNRRLILLTTKSKMSYHEFSFQEDDILLFGRESSGVPQNVHEMVDERLTIPMNENARSLNLALSAAIVSAEALRQIEGFPKL